MRSGQRFPYLALDPEETRSINAAYHQRIHKDQSNLIPLDPEAFVQTALTLLASDRYLQKGMAGPGGLGRFGGSRSTQTQLAPKNRPADGNSSTVEGPLQQQLPASDLTRRAACPYFSRTISFTFDVLFRGKPFVTLGGDDLPLFNGVVARAAFRVQETKQFLERLSIGRIPEECPFTAHPE